MPGGWGLACIISNLPLPASTDSGELEVTFSTFGFDAKSRLIDLKKKGVCVTVDDWGHEEGDLRSWHQFPGLL